MDNLFENQDKMSKKEMKELKERMETQGVEEADLLEAWLDTNAGTSIKKFIQSEEKIASFMATISEQWMMSNPMAMMMVVSDPVFVALLKSLVIYGAYKASTRAIIPAVFDDAMK